MGRGIDAQLIAAIEADERDWKRLDQEQARLEQKRLDDLERALDEMAQRARAIAREALTAAGYHQHHGGEWRKSRVARHREDKARAMADGRLRRYRAD
jgi:hypothetical protein